VETSSKKKHVEYPLCVLSHEEKADTESTEFHAENIQKNTRQGTEEDSTSTDLAGFPETQKEKKQQSPG
jgi:hypothetical protein